MSAARPDSVRRAVRRPLRDPRQGRDAVLPTGFRPRGWHSATLVPDSTGGGCAGVVAAGDDFSGSGHLAPGWSWARVWTLPAGSALRVGVVSHGGAGATADFDYFRLYRDR